MPDTQPVPTDADRLGAVRQRDAAWDGRFVYSVATTGVYCHPSCAARPARACNIAFHPTPDAAERAGFRPCKRCRPDLPPRRERDAAMVAAACRAIEAAEEEPDLATLAAAAGLSLHHFHRTFRRVAGVTPKAYAGAQRQARLQGGLAGGAGVTEAIYGAGFNSSGRFYAAAPAMLGMTASRYRAGAPGETIRHAAGPCSLGVVLVALAERGVCAILLGDDGAALLQDLRARFPCATLQDGGPDAAAAVAAVAAAVDQPGSAFPLPLDIRGTAFQRRVWEVLQAIPPGETLGYAAVAARLGQPAAARAVAAACAANPLAVAVPCHRVVAAGGGLAGYRWGVARKQALLRREAGDAQPPTPTSTEVIQT